MTNARRILTGVGTGPGDPELITVKALKALRTADVILVPETELRGAGTGRAEEIVTELVPEKAETVRRVPFSMSQKMEDRKATRTASADAAVAAFKEGATNVVLASVGDPNVFSTFTYLADRVVAQLPDVAVEVIPGITAMQAVAVAAETPLVSGREVLALVPATAGWERLDAALHAADTVVIYKGGRKIAEVVERVNAAGKVAVVATDLGLPNQRLTVDADPTTVEPSGYFTTVLATTPERNETW